jgi:FtsZ-binding cell division protein ZapB
LINTLSIDNLILLNKEIEEFKINATNNAIDSRNRLEKLENNLKKNNEFWAILKSNASKLIENSK